MRNADAVSSGVSSGEAISSKQKRLTGSRHETESAPPRDGGAAGPRNAREADSGRVARLRRTEPALLEPAPGAEDAVAASAGVRSAGAEGAGPGGGAGNGVGPARRQARHEAGASDLAVVFSPAGGVVTGHESEDADEDVRSPALNCLLRVAALRRCHLRAAQDAVEQRVPAHTQARWRTRVRMLADAGARMLADIRGAPRSTRDANSGGGSAAR